MTEQHDINNKLSLLKNLLSDSIFDNRALVLKCLDNIERLIDNLLSTQIKDETCSTVAGTYRLKSFVIRNKEGEIRKWRLSDSSGILIYTNDGHMSVNINAESSSELSINEQIDRVLSYAGRYKIVNDTIEHYVENASSIERISKTMVRNFSQKENDLELVGKGSFGTAILLWSRV